MFKKLVILGLVFIGCSGFFSVFSSKWNSHVPDELRKRTSVEYKLDDIHFFGPGGINEAFIVYNISDDVVEKINNNGVSYLENMPSTKKYDELEKKYHEDVANLKRLSKEEREVRFAYWNNVVGKYKNWQETPVKNEDKKWMRVSYGDYQDISMESFYGDTKSLSKELIERLERGTGEDKSHLTVKDFNFVYKIKPKYLKLIKDTISSEGNYYGYGEYGALVISPKHKKVFLLYRH